MQLRSILPDNVSLRELEDIQTQLHHLLVEKYGAAAAAEVSTPTVNWLHQQCDRHCSHSSSTAQRVENFLQRDAFSALKLFYVSSTAYARASKAAKLCTVRFMRYMYLYRSNNEGSK